MKSFHIVPGLIVPGLIILGLTLAAGPATAQQYTISTVAGIGTVQGYTGDGGPVSAAQFWSPGALALDSKGDLYISDYLQYVVREVSGGNINSIAGSNTFGFAGDFGPGFPQASLSLVQGLAVDPGGNLYIADTSNHVVRILNPSGSIYPFAGVNATPGYAGDGGKAINASLASPAGVAADASGNVYIADYGTWTVRKVDLKGMISTVAGNGTYGYSGDGGPAAKAQLALPSALAVDPAGNIFIADPGNRNIREITTDGNIHTAVSNVMASTIAVDAADSIYFPDDLNNTVQKILSNGTRFAIAGNGTRGFSGDGGLATGAQLQLYNSLSYGIAIDSSGNIYFSDSGNYVIRKLTAVASSVSVVNAASGVGAAIAPGEIVSIFGIGLGPSAPVVAQPDAVTGYYDTQLAGTTVSFNGVPAPVLYTSASQINAIAPYANPTAAGSTVTVDVNYQGQTMLSSSVPVALASPALFTVNAGGLGQAVAVNQDGSINSPSSPAHQGSVVTLYLTGEGQTSPGGIDGKPAPVTHPRPAPIPLLGGTAYLSGQPATVTYAGGAPGLVAGLMQLNVRIPANLLQTSIATPVAVPIQLVVGAGSVYFFVPSSLVMPGVTVSVAP